MVKTEMSALSDEQLISQPEASWRNGQYAYFQEQKAHYESVFSAFGVVVSETLDKVPSLDYDRFHEVNYAFWKLERELRICSFLEGLAATENADVEMNIVANLVSLAEAVYRLNKPFETVSENLIKGFFKSVLSKLEHKIRWRVWSSAPYERVFGAMETLYLVRNDYLHNKNFTGRFFRSQNSSEYTYNLGSFHYSEKSDKSRLILASSEVNLTYREFVAVFLEAFRLNVEKFMTEKSS